MSRAAVPSRPSARSRAVEVALAGLAVAVLLSPAASADPSRNLVRNGGFEAGEKLPSDWDIHEDVEAHAPGSVTRDARVFHSGASAVHLELPATGEPGVQGIVQVVELAGGLEKYRSAPLYFTGWVKTKDAVFLHVWVEFIDDKGFRISIHNLSATRAVSGTVDWSELGRVVTVPESAVKIAVGISLYGSGDLWVDDIGLVADMPAADVAAALQRSTPPVPQGSLLFLHEVQGACYVTGVGDSPDGAGKVFLSIPFPFEGQAPLTFRLSSIPTDRVQAARLVHRPQGDELEISMKAMAGGETVRLFWQSLVLATDRLLDPRALVSARIADGSAYPEDVRPWLGSEPGVEVEAPLVQGQAERLKTYNGYFLDFLQGMNAAIQDRLHPREGGDQSADVCLTAKKADSVGYANSVAAIARAGGVPARLVACAPASGEKSEQMAVEAYGQGVWWVRCEPESGAFPWTESRQVVLRVVATTDERSADHVPLPIRAAGPVRAGLVRGALREAASLRSDVLLNGGAPYQDLAPVLEKARANWNAALASPLAAENRFLSAADLGADLASRLAQGGLADVDGLAAAAWKRHANLVDSLQAGWGQSLARNPGFEEENRGRPMGWHASPAQRNWVEIDVARGQALRGEHSLHVLLKENRTKYEVISQRVSHFPVGLPLVMSAYVRGKCEGDLLLVATCLDEQRNPVDPPVVARVGIHGEAAWKRLSADIVAPRRTALLQLDLNTEGMGEFWVDEFDLRAGGGFPAYPGEELLQNPGFEDLDAGGVPAGWKPFLPPSGASEIDAAQEVSGRKDKWAGYLAAEKASAPYGMSQLVRYVPATGRVRLTGWVRTERLAGVASLSLVFRASPFDEGTEALDAVTTERTRPVKGTSDWTELTIEADVPPKTLSMVVRICGSGTGKIWFDDLSLQAVGK